MILTDAPPVAHTDLITQIASTAVALMLAVTTTLNHFKGKRRDRGNGSALETIAKKIDDNHKDTTVQFAAITREMLDLKAYVIGPDGENGLRGDVREIKEEVKGILNRERDRVNDPRGVGAYDRRAVHD